jgi:hypothetical protein
MAPVVSYMLEVDGYAGRLDSNFRRLKVRLECAAELAPALLRYLTPGYHPTQDAEPAALAKWLKVYEGGAAHAEADYAAR